MDNNPPPTATIRLHMPAEHDPIQREGFGVVPITVNGRAYRGLITKYERDETGTATDLWLEPFAGAGAGADGPVLFTLDELGHSVSAAEREAARAAR